MEEGDIEYESSQSSSSASDIGDTTLDFHVLEIDEQKDPTMKLAQKI